jgi:hypothetical protein
MESSAALAHRLSEVRAGVGVPSRSKRVEQIQFGVWWERLQTNERVARELMALEHLKTITVVNPINRCPAVRRGGRAVRARIRVPVR